MNIVHSQENVGYCTYFRLFKFGSFLKIIDDPEHHPFMVCADTHLKFLSTRNMNNY